MTDITIKQAMNRLKQAMKDEPDYAYSWHANIAMSVYDSSDGICHDHAHTLGNDAASRFMKLYFDAETSLHMLEK